MDRSEIQEKVIDIICKHSSIDRSAVTADKHLKLDLGLDSLDVAEMVYEIEETFGITIADENADKIQKISDTVEFIHGKLTTAAAQGLSPQER